MLFKFLKSLFSRKKNKVVISELNEIEKESHEFSEFEKYLAEYYPEIFLRLLYRDEHNGFDSEIFEDRIITDDDIFIGREEYDKFNVW